MTDPIFAVGDIHGQVDQLDRVLGLIDADPEAGAPVVFLGDYVDRGPHSREVIERLATGLREGRPWIPLMGNHDRYFLDFLTGRSTPLESRHWFGSNMGGWATLASYGVDVGNGRDVEAVRAAAQAAVPAAHLDLLKGLSLMHLTDAQIFVHAGIRPGVPLEAQVEDDLIWIREGFLDDRRDHGRLVVHGHTATEGPMHFGNRVNLDGGAGFGEPLCAALLLGSEAHLLTRKGRLRL